METKISSGNEEDVHKTPNAPTEICARLNCFPNITHKSLDNWLPPYLNWGEDNKTSGDHQSPDA